MVRFAMSAMLAHGRAALLIAAWTIMALGARAASAEPLSGTILDGTTLEPVAGATITVADSELVATSDAAGAYRFDDVPPGPLALRIEAPGYAASDERLVVPEGGAGEIVFVLLPPGLAGEIIEVTELAPSLPTPPGQTDLRREELTRIPGTRGDALTSIKSLPGVANADAAGAGPGLLVIRGAAPEDSKVTLDGVEIPLLYHFFGLQSIVPSEFIGAIDFLPGGFGVDEGRATGGVIRINTRADPVKETSGFAEISFINFAGYVQGPISREHNLQFAAGVRRSAVDLLLPAVIPDDATISFTTAPQYYDAQLRIDWLPDHQNRVTALGLASFDLLTLLNDTVFPNEPLLSGKWENETSFTRAIVTWQRSTNALENRLVAAAGTTGFRFEIGDQRFLRFEQQTVQVRDDLMWNVSPRLKLRAGGELVHNGNDARLRFPLPPSEGSGGPGNFSTAPLIDQMKSFDDRMAAAYMAVDISPVAGTTLTPGVRVDHFARIGHTTLLPRLSAQQRVGAGLTLRLAMGSYSRPPDQAEGLQDALDPELATQYVLGADRVIAAGITASLSGFYTDRRHLVVQDARAAAEDPSQAYVNRGLGRSFGAELLVRIKRDRLFGWVAYTLSKSDRIDGPMAERRLFDFDQTHNLIAVGSYTLGPWEFGGRWQYSTGNPFTPVMDSLYLADFNVYVPVYGDVNSERLAPAHQLDLRVDRKWRFRHWSLSAYIDITNVYANPRTLGYQYNFNFKQRQAIEELPLVPALGVRGSF